MNTGGDQGRDDYGLPPVDIEIPDDARELARDVQAYHRELRSRRRRHLARRLYGPLTRDGVVLPLLAVCLALTLVAATMLTVFTAKQPTASLRPQRPAIRHRLRGHPHSAGRGAGRHHSLRCGPADAAEHPPRPGRGAGADPARAAAAWPTCRKLTVAASEAKTLIYLVGVHNASVTAMTADLGLGPTQALEDRDGLAARALQGRGADGRRGPPGRFGADRW